MIKLFSKFITNIYIYIYIYIWLRQYKERRLLAKQQPLFEWKEGVLLATTPSKVVLYV